MECFLFSLPATFRAAVKGESGMILGWAGPSSAAPPTPKSQILPNLSDKTDEAREGTRG